MLNFWYSERCSRQIKLIVCIATCVMIFMAAQVQQLGAIFIGLNSPVVKSHGGTDYIGFSNSLDVCNRIIKGNLIDKIKDNIK